MIIESAINQRIYHISVSYRYMRVFFTSLGKDWCDMLSITFIDLKLYVKAVLCVKCLNVCPGI